MSKNMNVENSIPDAKSSTSVGRRGESSTATSKSGNHYGDRVGSARKPKVKR